MRNSLLKKFLIGGLLLLNGLIVFAQTDYKAKGQSAIQHGNYSEAINQFDAELAVLRSKKVSINSSAYIEIEKLKDRSVKCKGYSSTARSNLTYVADEKLREAFMSCASRDEAESKSESLLQYVDKAEGALKSILAIFPMDAASAKLKSDCDLIRKKIIGYRTDFSETEAWKKASHLKTLDAYQKFLVEYPSGNYSSLAKKQIKLIKDAQEEQALWDSISHSGTTADFQDFVTRFPSGAHYPEAIDALKKSKEKDAWTVALTQGTVKGYQAYLRKYPNGIYKTQARLNIDRLSEASIWQKAVDEGTVSAYQNYLAVSKKQAYKKDAEQRISQLKQEAARKADDLAWARARSANTIEAYYSYLTGSGQKFHSKEAESMANLLRARKSTSYSSIVYYYDKVSKEYLGSDDWERFRRAREEVLYQKFYSEKTISSGLEYLKMYPSGKYSLSVSDSIAEMKAELFTMYSGESDYRDAISFAKSQNVVQYVTSKYHSAQRQYKKYQRRLKSEPLHVLAGIGADLRIPFKSSRSDGGHLYYQFDAYLSLGGHSNRFNLEASYSLGLSEREDPVLHIMSISPQWNIVKKKYQGYPSTTRRSGSDYSGMYFYVAPIIGYNLGNLYGTTEGSPWFNRFDYGAKMGGGFSFLEFNTGYMVGSNSWFFGMSYYFGRK